MTSEERISEYLKPEEFWDIYGITSQKGFIEKIVTKGKFHKNVPKEIQSDYEIVERLLFYSYYKYSLIDEAFGKSTRIFEASIDLKIRMLDIEKKEFESLASKIKRLEKHSSGELFKQWMHSKNLRNTFAHHKAGRLMGITLINAFHYNINMINSVFLSKKEIFEKENSLKKIKERSNHLNKGLFIMKYKDKSFLIWSMIPYTSTIKNKIEKSFWVFHPVYNKKQIREISDFPDPFMLNLKNLRINEKGLEASIIDTNEEIEIISTNKTENLEKYNYHLKQMLEVELSLKEAYWIYLENRLNTGVSNFIYNFNWE